MTASFSERYGYRRADDRLIYEGAPPPIREGISTVINQMAPNPPHLRGVTERIAQRLGYPELVDSQFPTITLAKLLGAEPFGPEYAPWHQVFDLCEHAHQAFAATRDENEFSQNLNALFKRHVIGWEMRDGRMERRGDVYTDQAIQEARSLLRDSRFTGANDHFNKAIQHWSRRPEPDLENCVKDAVAAVESVVRVLLNNASIELDDGVRDLVRQNRIPQPLDQVITKLYAYRGAAPGVGHGAVQPAQVRPQDAEFVLATSAPPPSST